MRSLRPGRATRSPPWATAGAVVAALAAAAVVWLTLRAAVPAPVGAPVAGLASALAAAAVALVALALEARRLRQSADRMATHEKAAVAVLASVPELLFRVDDRGRLVFVNAHWARLTGRSVDEVLGRPLAALFVDEDAQKVQALLRGDAPAGARARVAVRLADGRACPHELALTALRSRRGECTGHTGSARDVSSEVATQGQLQTQLAFVASLLETSPLPLSVLDVHGRYLRVNRAWEKFTGRSREAVIGTAAASHYPPQEAARHDREDARLLAEGGSVSYEQPSTVRDGRVRDLYITKSVVPDADGRPAGIVCAVMDVSEFRGAERATRQARDAAEELLRARTEFVANMSHELRTPLQSILGFSELGLRRAAADPRVHGMFDDIHRAGQRMLALVNDLLDLAKLESRVVQVELHRTDLRDLMRETVHEFTPLLAPRRVQIELDLPRDQLVAKVDAPRLQQVVRNVLANALRFSPDGAAIEVRGWLAEGVDGGPDEVRIEIADRGPGIPDTERERIFEAFVQSSRTKDGAGGTGLGLAISREILRVHDGRIAARNRDGGGSVFDIALPAARFGDTLPAEL